MDQFYFYIKNLENRILRLEKFHQNSTGQNLLTPIIEETSDEELEKKIEDTRQTSIKNEKNEEKNLSDEEEDIELGEKKEKKSSSIKIGYYPEWGRYQHKYQIKDIPFNKYDYICYAFMLINPTKEDLRDANLKYPPKPYQEELPEGILVPHDGWAFGQNIKQLKNKNVLISIGGWTLSFNFSKILKSFQLRKRLITSIKWYLDEYNLAGIDIDWEYPNRAGRKQKNMNNQHSKQDGMYLRRFLMELRREIGNDKIIMSAVGCNKNIFECYKGTQEYLDFVLLMNYDYSGKNWGDKAPMSDIKTDKKYLSMFMDITSFKKDKILVGIPLYARGWWKKEDKGQLNFGKPYNEDGLISLKDIYEKEYEIKKDNETGSCYIENEDWFYSFADLDKKIDLSNEFAGFGVWSLPDYPEFNKYLI